MATTPILDSSFPGPVSDPITPRANRPKSRAFPSSPALMTISTIRLALSLDPNLTAELDPTSPESGAENTQYAKARPSGRPPLSPRSTSLSQLGTRHQGRHVGPARSVELSAWSRGVDDSTHSHASGHGVSVPHDIRSYIISRSGRHLTRITDSSPIRDRHFPPPESPGISLSDSAPVFKLPSSVSSSAAGLNLARSRSQKTGPMIPARESSRWTREETFGTEREVQRNVGDTSGDRRRRIGNGTGRGDGNVRATRPDDVESRWDGERDLGGPSTAMMDDLIAQMNPRSLDGTRSVDTGHRRRGGAGTNLRNLDIEAESRGLTTEIEQAGNRTRSGTVTQGLTPGDGRTANDRRKGPRSSGSPERDQVEESDASDDGPAAMEQERRRRRRARRLELGRRVPPERTYGRTQPIPITTSRRKDGLPTKEELQSIADELRGPASAPSQVARPEKSSMMSIEDIIKKHSTAVPQSFGRIHASATQPAVMARSRTAPPIGTKDTERPSENASMADMLQQSDALLHKLSDDPTPGSLHRRASVATNSTARGATKARSAGSGRSVASFESGGGASGTTAPIMEYLRSKRLNRLVTLQRPNQAGQVVSLADVGNANGYPVLVFFGLGCVRYLIALFDELAETLNLRLICIDRWGLGKSTDVPAEQRGLLEWANVVDEVMDQLKIRRFGILAHSAGAPYALAVAYKLEQRISGKAHLLAPWVNADIDGGYKWLKYVPTGVLKTAQATEWKVHGWMLGRLPKLQSEGIGHDAQAPSGFDSKSGIVNMGGQASWMDDAEEEDGRDSPAAPAPASMDRTFESGSSLTSWAEVQTEEVILSPKPERHAGGVFLGGMLSAVSRLSSTPNIVLATPAPTTFSRPISRGSDDASGGQSLDAPSKLTRRAISPMDRPPNTAEHSPIETSLVTSLLQASHAEALSGGTADLLAIMGRDSKPWGFRYEDVAIPCKVWYGEKDDKISEKSVRWMEREMRDVELRVMSGQGHDLLTSSVVMVEVLESLASDALVIARNEGRGRGR